MIYIHNCCTPNVVTTQPFFGLLVISTRTQGCCPITRQQRKRYGASKWVSASAWLLTYANTIRVVEPPLSPTKEYYEQDYNCCGTTICYNEMEKWTHPHHYRWKWWITTLPKKNGGRTEILQQKKKDEQDNDVVARRYATTKCKNEPARTATDENGKLITTS